MNTEIARKLKFLRKKHNYTQEYVANTIHVSRTTYTKYELGVRSPNAIVISKIIKLYQIDANILFHATIPPAFEISNTIHTYSLEVPPKLQKKYLKFVLKHAEDTIILLKKEGK